MYVEHGWKQQVVTHGWERWRSTYFVILEFLEATNSETHWPAHAWWHCECVDRPWCLVRCRRWKWHSPLFCVCGGLEESEKTRFCLTIVLPKLFVCSLKAHCTIFVDTFVSLWWYVFMRGCLFPIQFMLKLSNDETYVFKYKKKAQLLLWALRAADVALSSTLTSIVCPNPSWSSCSSFRSLWQNQVCSSQ